MRFPTIVILTFLLSETWGLNLPSYSTCGAIATTVTSARGRITSPNYPAKYPKNLDCKWKILSPKGAGIRMTIEHLDNKEFFEGGVGKCPTDKLQIASVKAGGASHSLHSEGELCAKNVNELTRKVFEIQNNGDGIVIAQISFESDYEDQGTGFSIHFEALCNHTRNGESGVITSPNYPNKYPSNADCFTEIHAPYGSTIELDFTNFQVETQSNCETDYIVIIEGNPGLYGVKSTRYCKGDIGTVRINSYIATVEFLSDESLQYSGFSATWKAVFPTTTTTTTTVSTTTATTRTTTTTTLETSTVEMKNCSYTNESLLCQRWDASTPHKPNFIPADSNHNFCRNPDSDDRGAWCYTTDPKKRWGYCDMENCVESTTITSEPSTTTSPPTTSDDSTSPFIAVFVGDPNVEKQTSDDATKSPVGLPWFAYLVIVAALVAFVIIALVFALRRRKRKSAVTITAPNTSDTVAFSQYDRDQYGERPRENTYVEIPFLGDVHEGNARRDLEEGPNETCGKGSFVRLSNGQSKNSSVSSLDSIQLAKEAAQRRYATDNRGASTSDANPYSVADDVANRQAPPPLPEDRGKRSLREANITAITAMEEDNVYHSIGTTQPTTNAANIFAGTPLPPPPITESVQNSSKTESSKKKSKEKKFMKKSSKPDLIPTTGFVNPFYKERDNSRDTFDEERNPFDTDDEGMADETTTYNIPSGPPFRSESTTVNEDESNLYNAPSMIPTIPDAKTVPKGSEQKSYTSADSPYMMPKIPMPSKVTKDTSMVAMSPDLIDDDKKKAFENDFRLYSSPNPTSPTFEMSEDFTYDSPRDGRSAASSFSSKAESDGGQTDSSGHTSTRSARDSGNASLSAAESVSDDKNHGEYCIMGSLSKPVKREKDTLAVSNQDSTENRLSHLYLTMKGTQPDRRVSESSWKAAKKQSSAPRKSV